ncbi:MAG: type 1 glutamine amidotransferase [Chloroflexi bacterium]|nr:type 1 glutamine amidotransferase [Chloroflexota bacterium]
MTPRIGIPAWRQPTGEKFRNYENSVRHAGGEPVRLGRDDTLDGVEGLLLTGGPDVTPRLYGEKRHPATKSPNRARDDHELSLVRAALARNVPVLAVCRGHQLLNVAFGGTVLQDVPGDTHRWHEDDSSSWHEVSLTADGRLACVYGNGARLRVNSRHHQAVTLERLAPGLSAVARSPDGLVEAVESRDHRWVMGVQWHPERPEMHPGADLLFAAFIAVCRDQSL